ncbi:unnamed protein product [Coccothraustes coccothraustes]
MQALRKAEDAYLEVSGAKGRCRTVFSRRRALESTGTGTMLSRRRSHFIASANRRARPLLRREERSRTTLAFSARTHQGQYLSSRLPFDRTERFLWREVLHNVAAHFARPPATLDCKLVEKLSAKIQALRQAEDAYLELSGAKGRSRTVFSRSGAWKSTGTGTMLSGRRSRVFASANRRARPLRRREDLSRTILAFNAQHSNSSRTVSPCEKIGKAVGEDAGAQNS